jgi:hypothetical protein
MMKRQKIPTSCYVPCHHKAYLIPNSHPNPIKKKEKKFFRKNSGNFSKRLLLTKEEKMVLQYISHSCANNLKKISKKSKVLSTVVHVTPCILLNRHGNSSQLIDSQEPTPYSSRGAVPPEGCGMWGYEKATLLGSDITGSTQRMTVTSD